MFIGLYQNHGRSSMSQHLLGIGAEYKSFEPAAPVRTQNNQVLIQLFGMFGDAPRHIALRDFVHVGRDIESPVPELFGDRFQITFGARDVLEVPVTVYAARRALLYHVEKFDGTSKAFRKPLHDWENRFGKS
jgi:hypothetical protein